MGVYNVNSTTNSQFNCSSSENVEIVEPDETQLSEVAERLGFDLSSLKKANPQIQDPDHLTSGQEIHLPSDPLPAPRLDPDPAPAETKGESTALPRAPVGDPLAANAMKAILGEPIGVRPQDYFRLDTMSPGAVNKTTVEVGRNVNSVGDVSSVEYSLDRQMKLNSQGMEQHLKEINNGGPLTPWEKQQATAWDKEDSDTTLTPIGKVGANGVQAYAMSKGGSGDRVTTYYDRNGNVLGGPFHSEQALVNEGLGALDYVMGALGARKLIGGLIKGGRAMIKAGTREAGEAGAEAAESRATGSQWRQGSGTSVYNPKPPSGGGFNAEELRSIKVYQDAGMTRAQAEDVIRRRGSETVEVVGTGPNAGGTNRIPDWKKVGAGNKTP